MTTDAFSTLAGEIADPSTGMTLSDVFTTGWCANLAAALEKLIPDARVVNVMDFDHENGSGHLIHAGVEMANLVIDIEGVSEAGEWFDRWSELSEGDECVVTWGTEGMSANPEADVLAAKTANKIARIIACGYSFGEVPVPRA